MNIGIFFLFFLSCKRLLCGGLANNLALTPPMGWTTWGRFRCEVDCQNYPDDCISEWLLRDMADKMVSEGYLSAGYNYIIIDDCWLARKRDSSGRLQPDGRRFPNGIKNLSNYMHSLGLNFGIYEDYGRKTCQGYPGILPGTIQTDVQTFAEWDIDYIKIDGCYSEPIDMIKGFEILGQWLSCTGRPIVYSCSWPFYQLNVGMSVNYTAAATMCNLWRIYRDIQDSWSSLRGIIEFFGDHQEEFSSVAGPGHWNDPDMLIIGNFGLSFEQSKVQMVIWAILAAPLIMSNDLRKMHPEFKKILQSPELIQLNQDPLGIQGKRIYIDRNKGYEVWTRPVTPIRGLRVSWVIAIINMNDEGEPNNIKFPMKYTKLWENLQSYYYFDLLDANSNVEINFHGELLSRIPPSGMKIYKAIPRTE